jgi:WD40 repeat protein
MSASTLHSDGIFSFDNRATSILTCSKDSTTKLSNLALTDDIAASSLRVIRTYDEYDIHQGHVIKCVRFQPRSEHIFANCGNSSSICIFDVRVESQAPSVRIESPHGRGTVNLIEWHPVNEYQMLSTGRSVAIALHDIRMPSDCPTNELIGHVAGSLCTTSQIYRPQYIDSGKLVVSPGERHDE